MIKEIAGLSSTSKLCNPGQFPRASYDHCFTVAFTTVWFYSVSLGCAQVALAKSESMGLLYTLLLMGSNSTLEKQGSQLPLTSLLKIAPMALSGPQDKPHTPQAGSHGLPETSSCLPPGSVPISAPCVSTPGTPGHRALASTDSSRCSGCAF